VSSFVFDEIDAVEKAQDANIASAGAIEAKKERRADFLRRDSRDQRAGRFEVSRTALPAAVQTDAPDK